MRKIINKEKEKKKKNEWCRKGQGVVALNFLEVGQRTKYKKRVERTRDAFTFQWDA